VTSTGPVEDPSTAEPASWREAAVARSLNPARKRAEKRVQRFLDAATELLDGSDGTEFTVQAVVDRSGQSLRSFYQYFGGKHELLMALFEEAVRTTAEHLGERVAGEHDAGERLHLFVVEYHRMCRPARKRSSAKGTKGTKGAKVASGPASSPVMVEFAQQLLTAHPSEAARVFVPLVTLFEEIFDAAVEGGVIRAGFDRRRITGVILESIMFNAFSATIAGASLQSDDDAAEELWDLLFHGLSA
jgi:AcrR family transcriptional regulator